MHWEFPQSLVRNDWESVSPVPLRGAGHRIDVQIIRPSVVPLHSSHFIADQINLGGPQSLPVV